MELWEIKANALKLMFADTDVQFSKEEFESGVLYENGNTRDKLVRMNDSIRRAIDLYYTYCGQHSKRTNVKYVNLIDFKDEIDLSSIEDFCLPVRIDLLPNRDNYIKRVDDLSYFFDQVSKKLYVSFYELGKYCLREVDPQKFDFLLYYKIARHNLPFDYEINELEYNLDSIYIPNEVQRAIPLYIKGEIYEEDEYALAQASKNQYLQFLLVQQTKFSSVQTRVKNTTFRRG